LNLIEQSCRRAKAEQSNDREQEKWAELEREKQIQESFSEVGENGIESLLDDLVVENYVRPTAETYRFAAFPNFAQTQSLLEMSSNQLAQIILPIVNIESPIHFDDLAKRTASVWGQRAGSRITARLAEIVRLLHRENHIELRGEFIWKKGGELRVRSRVGTNIPAERIAPEEVQEAILMILQAAKSGFTRQNLINEVRALFGFNRTGAALKQVIDDAIEVLLTRGIIGEGSAGIMLRK
jgi:hypothetical protein